MQGHLALVLTQATLWLAALPSLCAEDWPTFRHDNQRTGVAGESLRPPLALQWIFRSPFPPAKGWALPVNGYGARKTKPNVSHDDAYRVVAAGDMCYFSSSAENRIYAVHAPTGAVRWTVFTDGTPRLAPAYHEGKLYVGADDGVFRCLDAPTGRLLWQVDAAPRAELMLGHERFSSVWPIRAAGIVDDGVAYFTAGLFPSNHVYFYAVSAVDGKILWRRQLDTGGRGTRVPQGYILSTRDSLFTTCRVAPERWRKSDGRRVDFETPFPDVRKAHQYRYYNGGSYAQIWNGRYIAYGRACILAYDPDREFRDRWGRARKGGLVFNWFNARQALFHDGVAYLATDDHVLAVDENRLSDLARNECREYEEAYKELRVASYLGLLERHDRLIRERGSGHPEVKRLENGPLKWGREAWEKWPSVSAAIFQKLAKRCRWMTPGKTIEAFILADDVIYAGGDDGLDAIDTAAGRKLWSFETGSRVRGLAVANGRLFASSTDGTVRCFTKSAGAGRPADVRASKGSVPGGGDEQRRSLARVAEEIVRATGVSKGYCLIIGGGRGGLAMEVARRTDLRIEVVEEDAKKVDEARRRLAAVDLHGGRVCVRRALPGKLPYAPYVFNLVIDQGGLQRGRALVSFDEIIRATKPCGGVAVTGRAASLAGQPLDVDALAPDSERRRKLNLTVERRGDLLCVRRGRIPGSRDWTHNYANSSNTYSSEDPQVKGPFGVLWYGEPGPRKRIDRHAAPPMPLVVNGVLFTLGYDLVMAHDAYNGWKYWEREIPGATRQHLPLNTSNLAADEQSLFLVVSNKKCLRLEARTGRTLREYSAPPTSDGKRSAWAWIATASERLFGSLAEIDDRGQAAEQTSHTVFAVGGPDGELAWTYRGRGIDHDGIAVGEGKVFLLDRLLSASEKEEASRSNGPTWTASEVQPVDRKGRPVRDVRKLVALDASTGKTTWSKVLDLTDVTHDDRLVQKKSGAACMVKDGVVVVHGIGSIGHPHREFLEGKFDRRALYAFDLVTGAFLWGGRKGYRKRPIIVGDHVYAEPFAWHLRTGKARTVRNPLSGKPQTLDYHRGYIGCGHILASACSLFGARGGISYYNLDDLSGFVPFGGMALACGLCCVPANGVFVVPEGRAGCTCATPIFTSIALYPRQEGAFWGSGFSGRQAEVVSFPVRRVSINLGAPGYRSDGDGNLWIPYPARVEGGAIGDWLPTYQHDETMCFRADELWMFVSGTDVPWVFASGYSHEKPLRFPLIARGGSTTKSRYTLRLYFAELEDLKPGQRVFTVRVQGKPALVDLDVVGEAQGPRRALIKELRGIEVHDDLEIRLQASTKASLRRPILCGFQAFRE